MISAEVIKNRNLEDINFAFGHLSNHADKVLPPELCDSSSLVFVSKAEQLQQAAKAQAPIIIAHKSLTVSAAECPASTVFITGSVHLAMSQVLPLFDGKMNRFNQEQRLHPTAQIHPTAHLGKNVTLAPFVVIGEGVNIGDGCTIGANTVIESFAKIGDHSLIHPLVFIGSHCELGSYCEVHPHTTIGADGFSFAMNKKREPQKIPQLGRVIIGNHVEIGANCAIDRAAMTATRIGNNTKLDNFCHVAHNVTIGDNGVMAAGFKVAGSTRIGNHFMAGGDSGAKDHVTIVDNVALAGRTAALSDLLEPGAYGGTPAVPLREHLKTVVHISQLSQLKKRVSSIMKHLNLSEND